MYCWVMVEPPCSSPPRAITQAARNMPRMEMPWSVQKVAVLGGDDGLLDVLGHLLEGERLPVLDREAAELGLAVVVVDEGGGGLEVGVRVGPVRGLVADDDDGARAEHAPARSGSRGSAATRVRMRRPRDCVSCARVRSRGSSTGPQEISHRCPRRSADDVAACASPRRPGDRTRSCGSSGRTGTPRRPRP